MTSNILTIRDSIEVTIQRTGAATAVAAKYLGPPQAGISILGEPFTAGTWTSR